MGELLHGLLRRPRRALLRSGGPAARQGGGGRPVPTASGAGGRRRLGETAWLGAGLSRPAGDGMEFSLSAEQRELKEAAVTFARAKLDQGLAKHEERDLRDAVAGTVYSGISEVQRVILSRMLGL